VAKNIVDKAKEYAKKFHKGHTRVSGKTYYEHLDKTASALQKYNVNDEILLASVYLHHILSFDETKESELLDLFGTEVVKLLKEYRKFATPALKDISLNEQTQKVVIPMYFNLVEDPRALIILIADKAESIKTAHLLTQEHAHRAANKAIHVYAQLARLLGLFEYVKDLENNAFKIIDPFNYYLINHYIRSREEKINKTFADISKVLFEILEENNIKAHVDFRTKHLYSVYRKLLKYQKKDEKADISKIFDIAAMRIIVDTVENCYSTEGILKELWDEIQDQRDDYIQHPKASGYKSIHNVFKVESDLHFEIQIKTQDMHHENEFGRASHTFYKMGELTKGGLKDNPTWIKEVNFVETGGNIKTNQFADFVYVFTPKGDVIELPKGSNLIDFAYAIHKEIGDTAVAGLVNGEYQRLNFKPKTGDTVEIQRSSSKKSQSSDWVKEVKTGRARIQIRRANKRKQV
jgi:GTP diphosphokinase / guanosine-3',5'-bis(diphosphate) 3'-diphosphatase